MDEEVKKLLLKQYRQIKTETLESMLEHNNTINYVIETVLWERQEQSQKGDASVVQSEE